MSNMGILTRIEVADKAITSSDLAHKERVELRELLSACLGGDRGQSRLIAKYITERQLGLGRSARIKRAEERAGREMC